ncbi:MAG: response regulator transcription factor [Dysgonamonadaceae bacterium]|jgi:DNA-binding response OmpR family regulator|nr:response regulator transcription factor [Dysgonamonadaceae bacterium]
MTNVSTDLQSPKKILIVDDEEDILEILRFNLENEGFIVDTAISGEEALAKLTPEHCLILLDVMMDGLSGYLVAEQLRNDNIQTPIIFLTARNTENDMLTCFSVGGDDYIAKPFPIKEVIARIKAITRRNYETFPSLKEKKHTIIFKNLKLNLVAKDIEINSCSLVLTKKEYEILCLLMQHQGQIFTREDILEKVWKDESYVLERTVDVHITRLRKKLNEYGVCIANRQSYGYYFDNKAIT